MSSYSPKCVYYKIVRNSDGSFVKQSAGVQVCFGGFSPQNIYSVEYHVEIDKTIDNDMVEYYMKFLSRLLDTSLYSYKIEVDENLNRTFIFTLKTELEKVNEKYTYMSRALALLYFTAIRYFQEFPEIILDIYEKKDKVFSSSKIYEKFLLAHNNYSKLAHKKYNNLCGHGLIYYNPHLNKTFEKDIKKIREIIKNKTNTNSVMSHFYSVTPPPSKL
jgi:hypothetical protein